MSELLHITIDGKDCTCERGEYLWDVAKRNGVPIPVLCRSDAFPEHRACCRVCIVEVETRGRTKVVTSCVYPVEQECEVRTNSERIKEERSVVLGLLAARAPEAQRVTFLSQAMGNEGLERLITLDGEKCVLCGLCVQACDSLGTSAISTVNRGVDKMVSTPYGDPSSSCVGCLSCANVCPTEAIPYTQTADARTIWNRTFELVKCERCGAVMGTPESVAHAAKRAGLDEVPTLCDECRKKLIADEMMPAYRLS